MPFRFYLSVSIDNAANGIQTTLLLPVEQTEVLIILLSRLL